MKTQAEPMSKMRAATIISYGGDRPTGVSVGRWRAIVAQVAKDGITYHDGCPIRALDNKDKSNDSDRAWHVV